MKMLILKSGQDLGRLTATLAGAGGSAAALARLRALNPHLDLNRLEPGTVLLLPDEVGEADGAESVAGEAFDALAEQVTAGLKTAGTRVRAGYAAADQARKDVAAALKTAALKRIVEGDAELARQLAAAETAAKAERERAKAADATFTALETALARELAVLDKLVR